VIGGEWPGGLIDSIGVGQRWLRGVILLRMGKSVWRESVSMIRHLGGLVPHCLMQEA
jgi:hypothetical protein